MEVIIKMASILDRYGIKEVADVTFYALNENGVPMYPVLYLDTLKVSTIEQTAETTEARGGKGNPALIAWDYGKEINVTLEDALFSAKSMAIMFGNGSVKEYNYSGTACMDGLIMKTEVWTATNNTSSAGDAGWDAYYHAGNGNKYEKRNAKQYLANAQGTTAGNSVTPSAFVEGQKYFCTFDIAVKGKVIEISANSFPGTYYVTGDTFARSDASGMDEFFQFIIPKAKVNAENTITLEAEGDPSVFNLSLKVLRPADGVMMKLVQYNPEEPIEDKGVESIIRHNHDLLGGTNRPTG